MRICGTAMHCLISCLKVRPGFSFKSTALILLTGVRGGWSYHVSVRVGFRGQWEARRLSKGCAYRCEGEEEGVEDGGEVGWLRLEAETG